MNARHRVADFWDDVLARWTPSDQGAELIEPLRGWWASYAGTGKGAVDPSCYPDPYVGDLRGDTHRVCSVILGLNPGVGYPSLQAPDGLWMQRIREVGYSNCFRRSPAEDPEAWVRLHGKESAYWRNLVKFVRRWHHDDGLDVHSILNLELYPWHLTGVVGAMSPPPAVIEEFVWQPVQDVDVPVVFAFGAPWFQVCEGLRLPAVGRWGAGAHPLPGVEVDKGWRVAAYGLASGQFAVVSAQPGYSGPPGPARLEVLREIVEGLT